MTNFWMNNFSCGILYLVDGSSTRIFLQGCYFGEVVRSSEACLLRYPDERKRLFASYEEFEREFLLVVQKHTHAQLN